MKEYRCILADERIFVKESIAANSADEVAELFMQKHFPANYIIRKGASVSRTHNYLTSVSHRELICYELQ